MEKKDATPKIDILTLIAISIVAWSLVVILHEVVGHTFLAILMGLDVRVVSTTAVDVPTSQVAYDLWNSGKGRILLAGGTVVNLLSGAIALLLLYKHQSISKASRYFLWLFSTFSFIIVIMYLVTATAIGAGDWIGFVQGLESKDLYTTIIIGIGILFVLPGYALPLRGWMPNLKGKRLSLLKVTSVPVLALTITQVLSVLRSPFPSQAGGQDHMVISFFVCIHFFVWAILVNLVPIPRSSNEVDSIDLGRSLFWLVAGIIFFLFFVLVLGPGIGPLSGIE
jgi:hypothetical protein